MRMRRPPGPRQTQATVSHLFAELPRQNFLAHPGKTNTHYQFHFNHHLFQSDEDFIIQFRVEQFHLPCGTQWLKIRDGSSLSSNLLAHLTGDPENSPSVVNSTGPNLLLEFFSDEITAGGQLCGGGFLAHATQISMSSQILLCSCTFILFNLF